MKPTREREFVFFDDERAKDEASLAVEFALNESSTTRADLARRLRNSPSYVTKILGDPPNYTVTKLAAILRAMGFYLHFAISKTPWEYVPPIRLDLDKGPTIAAKPERAAQVPVLQIPFSIPPSTYGVFATARTESRAAQPLQWGQV